MFMLIATTVGAFYAGKYAAKAASTIIVKCTSAVIDAFSRKEKPHQLQVINAPNNEVRFFSQEIKSGNIHKLLCDGKPLKVSEWMCLATIQHVNPQVVAATAVVSSEWHVTIHGIDNWTESVYVNIMAMRHFGSTSRNPMSSISSIGL